MSASTMRAWFSVQPCLGDVSLANIGLTDRLVPAFLLVLCSLAKVKSSFQFFFALVTASTSASFIKLVLH